MKPKKVDWVDKKRLKDPMFWFMKASFYHSAALYLQGEFQKQTGNVLDLLNAIHTVPYLTGICAELYLKGYLVYQGKSPKFLREKSHNLSSLRKECLKFGDPRFNDDDLIFLTDTLGPHIMEDGGIRYPDKKEMPIYITHFGKALNILREPIREIEEKLATKI